MMILKEIENILAKKGYITQIHSSINSLTIALPDKEDDPVFGTTSRVELLEGNLIYIYIYIL